MKAFADYVSAYPWAWTSAMVDEWLGDLRSLRDLKRSTIRSYSEAVRAFCHFATDPPYGWAETCEERFGTHPVQVVHEWNTAVHVQDNEAAAGAALQIPRLLAPVLAGDAVFGAAIPWLVVGLISLTQRLTPAELQGRVYAAVEFLITTPQTISVALGAALITVAGYQTLLLAMAVVIALAAVYLLTRPEQRRGSAPAQPRLPAEAAEPAGSAEPRVRSGERS